jgi:hypothetical protein
MQVPQQKNVKLTARFYYPEGTPTDTEQLLIMTGYDTDNKSLFSKQIKATASGSGTELQADITPLVGKSLRVTLTFRHLSGTPLSDAIIDLASFDMQYDEVTTSKKVQTGIGFAQRNRTITVGESVDLPVNQLFNDGTSIRWSPGSNVVWESDRPDIATINPANGTVTGNREGMAKISLFSGNYVATSYIRVLAHNGDPSSDSAGIVADHSYVRMQTGKSIQLNLKEISPQGFYRELLLRPTFSTTNSDIVDISEGGIVNAKRPGTAIVQVDVGWQRAKILVEVSRNGEFPVDNNQGWSIIERSPGIDINNTNAYRYVGLHLTD